MLIVPNTAIPIYSKCVATMLGVTRLTHRSGLSRFWRSCMERSSTRSNNSPTGTKSHLQRPRIKLLTFQLYYVAQIFYALIQNIAKFSILFLYLRIFPTPQFRLAVKLSMVVIVCHTIAFTIGVGMQCLPLDSLWDLTIHAKCIDIHVFAISGAVLSIFYDIVIMLLPISELKGLNLTLKKRIALCFMFALGSLYASYHSPPPIPESNINVFSACVTSMVRLKYLKDFYPTIDASCKFLPSPPLPPRAWY